VSGPIPWTAIDRYAERTGLDPDNDEVLYDDLIFFIESLDEVYRKWEQAKVESANKSKKPSTDW
jgi:hypothetical protein